MAFFKTSISSTKIAPESGFKYPVKILIIVDFPAPFGPKKPII